MELQIIDYKDYTIEINRVPPEQEIFDFGGFGLAFFAKSSKLSFTVVVKSLSAEPTESNLNSVLELGKSIVYSLINSEKLEKTYYCYRWEINEIGDGLREVDCKDILFAPYLTRLP